MRAINLKRDEIIAAHTHRPGRVDMGDGAAFQLEGGVGGIVGIRRIGVALFIETLGDMGGAEATYGFHRSE
ncbi:hypothetical protein D3C80_2122880 [compost metagenome]